MSRYRTISVGFAASLATVTVLTYWMMNHTTIDQGTKWEIFGLHLLATSVGVMIGAYGVVKGWWLAILPTLVCAYFFYLQLLS
jgi:hypothetical protein